MRPKSASLKACERAPPEFLGNPTSPISMATLARLLADYQLAPDEARRELLLAIGHAAAGAEVRLGDFGAVPAEEPAFVVDAEGKLHVSSRKEGLLFAARTMGMEVFDPAPMQDAEGRKAGFAVMYETAGAFGELARGNSEDEASLAAAAHLEQIVGSLVITLQCWFEGQLHTGFDAAQPKTRRKRRAPVIAEIGTVTYAGQWKAAGVYRWTREGEWSPQQMKAAEAMSVLAMGHSLKRVDQRGVPRYTLQVVHMEGQWYAEHHDLVTAARAGVFLPDLHPWPNVGANAFVVVRNYQRYMRTRGWRAPWVDESTSGSIRIHGQHWLRAQPLPMP